MPTTTTTTNTDETSDESSGKRRLARTLTVIQTLVLASLALASSPGGVGRVLAQTNNTTNISDKAPYYANKSTSVGMDSWLTGTENASLESLVGLVMRIPGVVIGTGPMAPGGIGYAGGLVLSILVLVMSTGVVIGTGMGMVAATILFTAVLGGLVTIGMAPGWLWLVVLIGVGALGYRALHSLLS